MQYQPLASFDPVHVEFTLGTDRQGKTTIHPSYDGGAIAFVTPPAVTMWPRVDGDGNFGTMFGPTDPQKAKFTLDITDGKINGADNEGFGRFAAKLNALDDKLLDFVHAYQEKILKRRNLSKDELKMLQIRTVKPKYDKLSGALTGYAVNLSTSKYAWDGMGGKQERKITICDHQGRKVDGSVCPGDVVAATMYLNQCYTGVGGDKFGFHWSFEDVSVVCQRAHTTCKSEVAAFAGQQFDFARDFTSEIMTDEPSYGAVAS